MCLALEHWLEAERDQLPLWLPVMLGVGMAVWFALPSREQWIAAMLGCLGAAVAGFAVARGGRVGQSAIVAMLAIAAGCCLIWVRAERVAAPVLARPVVSSFDATVEVVERFPARGVVRLRLATDADGLPPRIRVNLAEKDEIAGIAPGARIRLRARLMPPAPAAVPGAYDFARTAWFAGIGATGRVLGVPVVRAPAERAGDAMRARLTGHIQSRISGSAGGVAAALVTGDRGAITVEDDEALRRSGLAHLLSVSGLHVTAVVGATMVVVLRLLALLPVLALRLRLPVVAALVAAVVAGFYTWLTGAEVPTVRSLIAALIVLAALAMGREAITLRLVATGAAIVLVFWPESIASASFQLSFAAVTAIVALHEHPRMQRWFGVREEGRTARFARGIGSLLLTGLVIELALMPIGLFHFHKAGLYGAAANIVAIPLTTFVVMPLEAAALALDTAGLGAPIWWLAELGLKLILWIAHTTADAPGSVAALPAMPTGAFASMIAGGLWVALWRTRWRWLGILPFACGALWAAATPAPDLIVTGDGRHAALRGRDGAMRLLRERSGDYVRGIMSEAAGLDAALPALEGAPGARCSRDICIAPIRAGQHRWMVAATRSMDYLPIGEMLAVCRSSDIVISDRRLPRGCSPRWLKLDRQSLAETGGVSIVLNPPRVTVVRQAGAHPWKNPEKVMPGRISPSRPHGKVKTDRRSPAR